MFLRTAETYLSYLRALLSLLLYVYLCSRFNFAVVYGLMINLLLLTESNDLAPFCLP